MTIQEVYEKYKHHDAYFSNAGLIEATPLLNATVLFTLWQAVKGEIETGRSERPIFECGQWQAEAERLGELVTELREQVAHSAKDHTGRLQAFIDNYSKVCGSYLREIEVLRDRVAKLEEDKRQLEWRITILKA